MLLSLQVCNAMHFSSYIFFRFSFLCLQNFELSRLSWNLISKHCKDNNFTTAVSSPPKWGSVIHKLTFLHWRAYFLIFFSYYGFRLLDGNVISGRIPEELGNLSSLTTLNLGRNSFNGSIPNSLGGLLKLQNL